MNKNTFFALAMAPAICMTAYADNATTAQDTLKGAIIELTELTKASTDKELEPLIADLHALLEKVTPGILTALEPLTDEERMSILGALSGSPELAALMQAAEPMGESKAAAAIMPMMGNNNPAAAVDSISYTAKMQLIDVVANLTKIAIGLGADKMAAMMGSCDETEEITIDEEY